MQTGRCAIIRQTAETVLEFDGTLVEENSLMVLLEQEDDTEFVVRKRCIVGLRGATEAETIVAETMTEIVEVLASEQVMANFIAVWGQVGPNEYEVVKTKLWERMEELVAEARGAKPKFADAVEVVSIGDGSQKYTWTDLLEIFPHRFVLERIPDDQVWLVD